MRALFLAVSMQNCTTSRVHIANTECRVFKRVQLILQIHTLPLNRLFQIALFATAIGPSNGGRADFLRRERQLLEQRRQQLRDSGPGEPLQKIGEGYEGGKGYRFETPDNPLILTRPQPKFTPEEKEVHMSDLDFVAKWTS